MALNSFIRRASCSINLRGAYQREIVRLNVENSTRRGIVGGGQFSSFVRFFTGSVDKTAPPKKAADKEEISARSPSVVKTAPPPKKLSVGEDDLPFVVKEGRDKGTLTLARKCQDEIVQIDVRAYRNVMDYYDDHCPPLYCGADDDSYRADWRAYRRSNSDLKLETANEVASVSPCLHLEVKIFHGDMYRKLVKFDVVAFPDSPDDILIHSMNVSRLRSADDEEYAQLHLEDFEDLLKIKPSDFNFLFHHFERLGEIRSAPVM